MNFITNKSSERQDIQPMLLRRNDTPSWIYHGGVWCLIAVLIATGMIVVGYLMSENPIVVSHPNANIPLNKPIAPVVLQKPMVQETQLIVKNMTSPHLNYYAEQNYQKAVVLIKNGQISNAINNLTTAITINPTFQKAREALAALYIQNDHVSKALHLLDKGLDLTPDYYPFIKLKAQIFINEGLYQDALNLLTQDLPAIKDHPQYYALLAVAYTKEKKYLIAADIYRQLTELNPNNGEWWFGLGASLNLAGKNEDAKTAYQKALDVGGINPAVRAYLETQLGS